MLSEAEVGVEIQTLYPFTQNKKMKISYNWLKNYIKTDKSLDEISEILTNTGLEVEGIETIESIKGGLEGLIIGKVKTCQKHPNADKLSLTTVDVAGEKDLQIVCGAPNVAAGQTVVVAPVGTTIHPISGDGFKIKKSKIRGELSEGMICAEDEIGLGNDHDGILVLSDDAKIGSLAKNYFKIENDSVIEIGLTPNRSDAICHLGVARDIAAVLDLKVNYPEIKMQDNSTDEMPIEIEIENPEGCPRYSGISIKNIQVAPSPDWLQNCLKAIGLNPINNIVDITNFVMHETGQPLHAFDYEKIKGQKIVVKNAIKGSKLTFLDKSEKTLRAEDLMIWNAEEAMAMAGVMGGLDDSISDSTKNIFIESAHFNPVLVRKSSKFHSLKTDAAFRFERGADYNNTIYALQRCTDLILEIAGGAIASKIKDNQALAYEFQEVELRLDFLNRFAGKDFPAEKVKEILLALDFEILSEENKTLKLKVPSYRVDVKREVDVIEEILRIYGFNNISNETSINYEVGFPAKSLKHTWKEIVANQLLGNGFNEIMCNSLTKSNHLKFLPSADGQAVEVINPLSEDLTIMRPSMVLGGLDSIIHNINHQQKDLKFFEFGRTYLKTEEKYKEKDLLSIWITGKNKPESWYENNKATDFYQILAQVKQVLNRMGFDKFQTKNSENELFSTGLAFTQGPAVLVEIGKIKNSILKNFDIKQDVFYAELAWDKLIKQTLKKSIQFQEIAKFPAVRRDLALELDKEIKYQEIEKIARKTEKKLLKAINVFDVYEGEKMAKDKKSYAVSFMLQDEKQTLKDKQIDAVMKKLIQNFEKELGAGIR